MSLARMKVTPPGASASKRGVQSSEAKAIKGVMTTLIFSERFFLFAEARK
jgi:hypothetical protein